MDVVRADASEARAVVEEVTAQLSKLRSDVSSDAEVKKDAQGLLEELRIDHTKRLADLTNKKQQLEEYGYFSFDLLRTVGALRSSQKSVTEDTVKNRARLCTLRNERADELRNLRGNAVTKLELYEELQNK